MPAELSAWSNFYVIAGSSAGALTGLMFVGVTIVASRPGRANDEGISTFSSPTVLHFCAALLIAAVLTVPWSGLAPAAVLLALEALFGIAYVGRIIASVSRMAKRAAYTPDREDWGWYVAMPMAAYITLLAAAVTLPAQAGGALYGIAAATITLVFVGIRNAWDVVTYVATGKADELEDRQPPG
ncbi:MAG TPA: hypothetical protein VGN14_11750 [Candidatus Elarobacter sp.]|jgi:hypothetical protein